MGISMVQERNTEGLSWRRRKALLIVSEPSFRDFLSTFLITMGWSCAKAADLEEALAAIEGEMFEAIVMDLFYLDAHIERAIRGMKAIRPSLADRILAICSDDAGRVATELIERTGLVRVSRENLLQQLWATLEGLFVSEGMHMRTPQAMQIAHLVFDSFSAPAAAGVRSSHRRVRQLAYEHKSAIIDVSIEPVEGTSRMSLTGQVLDAARRKGKTHGLAVVLTDGMQALERIATNTFGEFHLESEFPEKAGLEIRLEDGSWVEVPLGNMSWMRKRLSKSQGKD